MELASRKDIISIKLSIPHTSRYLYHTLSLSCSLFGHSQICDFFSFSLSSSSFIPFMIHPLDFLAYSSAASLFFMISFILLKSSGTFIPL